MGKFGNNIDVNNSVIIIEAPGKKDSWFKYTGITTVATYGHFKDLPENEFGIDLSKYVGNFQVTKSGRKVARDLLEKCKGKDVYIAADMDREGDAIGYFVAKHVEKEARNIFRVSVNKITESDTVKGINESFPFSDVSLNKIKGFFARRLGDRMVGFLLSPIASKSLEGAYSVGRVQTVAVRLVKEREDEIKKFKVEKYWTIEALYKYNDDVFKFNYENSEKDNNRFTSLAHAREVLEGIIGDGKNGVVRSVESKRGIRNPPPPFITSSLQQEMSVLYNLDVEETMKIAQKLYEGKGNGGFITYHRTDATFLDESFVESVRNYIDKEINPDLLPVAAVKHVSKKSQADAHEAIRPLDITYTGDDLGENEKKVYQAIRDRAIACQMIPMIFDSVEILVDVNGNSFVHKGKIVIEKGFTSFYKESKAEALLPQLNEGDSVVFDDIALKEGKTKAPARYNQASLVGELEKRGIGRPSTYASIVKKIKDKGYVAEVVEKKGGKKKSFRCLEKGDHLIEFALSDERLSWICDYDMTKKMEDTIEDIVDGKIEYKEFLKEIHGKMGFMTYEKNEIEARDVDGATCLCCGSKIVDRGKVYACHEYKYDKAKGYSTGCQFVLWKESKALDDEINDEILLQLLDGEIIEGINSKHLCLDAELIESCSGGAYNKNNKAFLSLKKEWVESVSCPLCEKRVYDSGKQFVCEDSKLIVKDKKFINKGCKFRVNKDLTYFETIVDEGVLQDLLDGKVIPCSNGKELIFDKENEWFFVDKNYVKKEVVEKTTIGVKCPKCKSGEFVDHGDFWKCSRAVSKKVGDKWKNSGCQFAVWKHNKFADHTISAEELKQMSLGEKIKIDSGQTMSLDPVGKYSIVVE